jgi:hypothetical protein
MNSKTLKQALKHDYDYIRKQLAVYVLDAHKNQALAAVDGDIYNVDAVLAEARKCHKLLRRYSDTLSYFRRLRHRLFVSPKWKVERAFRELATDLCCLSASLFDTGNKVEFVGDITHLWGERKTPEERVWLWRLRYPIDIAGWQDFDELEDDDEMRTMNTLYVVTSAANVESCWGESEPETYVFAVERDSLHPTHRSKWVKDETAKYGGRSERLPVGEGDWGELEGSYKGDLDHMQAIIPFQRWLLNPLAINKSWRYHKQA